MNAIEAYATREASRVLSAAVAKTVAYDNIKATFDDNRMCIVFPAGALDREFSDRPFVHKYFERLGLRPI